ncbi:MAG: hypothetical protein JWN46_3712 [Acidimicrobiales bacterium]|nr:hypothetical protein [Acidimicrobiales bacterium]
MRFAIETWAPEYGAPIEDAALVDSGEVVDVDVELPFAQWGPRAPAQASRPPGSYAFVDGVRRVDARIWVSGDDGVARQGICATYAAGVVCCRGTEAKVVAAEVRRGAFVGGGALGAEAITTRHGTYRLHPVASEEPDRLPIALQDAMGELEHRVSAELGTAAVDPDGLLVVDGPLRERARLPGAVGYVKTHRTSYLPDGGDRIVGALGAGERTPLFLIGGRWSRWSWYLRLPGVIGHAWSGVVRCEASADLPVAAAILLADRVATGLPRFASVPQKDPRAPQNLFPIAGLERELRRRLGDPALLLRSLRLAAA